MRAWKQQRFVVATDKGRRIESGALVLAAAVGTGKVAKRFGIDVPTRAEPLHMNITEPTTPMIEHLVQHADRMITLKQFSTGQIVIGGGWPADLAGDREHPTVRLDSLIANATLACHIAPVIAPLRIIRTWAGINTSVDGKGVLGPIPSVPGLFFAVPAMPAIRSDRFRRAWWRIWWWIAIRVRTWRITGRNVLRPEGGGPIIGRRLGILRTAGPG